METQMYFLKTPLFLIYIYIYIKVVILVAIFAPERRICAARRGTIAVAVGPGATRRGARGARTVRATAAAAVGPEGGRGGMK